MNVKDELVRCASNLLSEVKIANTLVDEGKEVHCSRKLQGARTRIMNLMDIIKLIPNELNVTIPEVHTENVAEATS